MSVEKRKTTVNHAAIILLLAGIVSVIEGPYLIGASGIPFSSYVCQALVCGNTYEMMLLEYVGGIQMAVLGSVLMVGSLLTIIRRGRKQTAATTVAGATSVFDNSAQKRHILTSAALVMLVAIFFLAPIVPVQTKPFPEQISGAHISCRMTDLGIFSPVYIYRGYASPSEQLLGVGNIVYASCIVTSSYNSDSR